MNALVRWAVCLLASILVVSLSGASWAAGDPLTVVGPFSGDKKAQIRERFIKAMEASGIPIGDESFSPAEDASDAEFKAAAAKHNVQAFILGTTAMSPKGWTLKITVRNGKTGEVLGEKSVKASWLPGLLKKIDAGAAGAVAPLLDHAEPPGAGKGGGEVLDADGGEVLDADDAAEKPKAAASEEDEEEEEEVATDAKAKSEDEEEEEEEAAESDAASGGDEATEEEEEEEEVATETDDLKPSPFDVALSVGVLNRALNGTDDEFQTFREQRHNGTMLAIGVSGGLYPGVLFTDGVLSNIGLIAGYESSLLGQVPVGAAGMRRNIDSVSSQFDLGARLRLPIGRQEFGMSAAFMQHSFTFGFADPATRIIPDIDYTMARVGADIRLRFLGPWGVKLQGGYRIVADPGKSPGQIGNATRVLRTIPGSEPYWYRYGFEDATASGFDLAADVQYWFYDKLAITAGASFRHYYFDFHFDSAKQQELGNMSPPEILQPVGGATDDYLIFRIGAELRL